MIGSWIGYVFVILACAASGVLLGGSTLLLYAIARAQRRGEPRVRAVSVTVRSETGSSDAT